MICEACRKGADFLAEVVRLGDTPRPGSVAYAEACHANCKGCDCQHRVQVQADGATTA